MKYLEGKFFLRSDADTYRTGQVIKVDEGTALVAYDNMANPNEDWAFPMELVCLHDEMTHGETELGKIWGFFNTREELAAYLHWVDTPQGPQVVKLVPKKPVP